MIFDYPFSGIFADKYMALRSKPQFPAGLIYSHTDEVFHLPEVFFTGKKLFILPGLNYKTNE